MRWQQHAEPCWICILKTMFCNFLGRHELVSTRDPAQVMVVIQESQHADRSAATAGRASIQTRTGLDARPSSSPGRDPRITTR
jgi:hypothetical protein